MKNNLDTSLFFEAIFYNAKQNSVIVMDVNGIILQINEAFTKAFDYLPEDVEGKNFDMLFTTQDREKNKPALELQKVVTYGSANDDNYLVHKNGMAVWVTGESVAVGKGDVQWLVKIIHNINAAKQLERFLEEAEEFIESIFESDQDVAMLMLDMRLKVIKVNKTFMQFFDLQLQPLPGASLGSLHPFWNDPKVKECLREILIKNKSLKDFEMEVSANETLHKYRLDSKMITDNSLSERRLLIVVHKLADK